MARAFPHLDNPDTAPDPQAGEWQALRGELVALLDQVEGRYARADQRDPGYSGLAQRVRNLRDQVVGSEPAVRQREALRTVKRAVDRFSERDESTGDDPLQSAIAEIRSRQFSAPAAALGRRVTDAIEFRDLSALVEGLSGRLGQLEGELKSQRSGNTGIREVASQVEQLTHVVELLAGAVGETGQVKRLEMQISSLAQLIEAAPRTDLSAVNARLDDVSVTVGKLAELQAQQMEREIERQDRDVLHADAAQEMLAPIQAIEKGVRNVYDRIDAIERNVAMSSGDVERLTAEMAAFTQAVRDRDVAPGQLLAKMDMLMARFGTTDSTNGDVVGLKQDMSALRDAVMSGMEPRFSRIESQIEALSEKVAQPKGAPASSAQIEGQLKLLMARMDETGAQLNDLSKLYSAPGSGGTGEAGLAAFEKRMTALLNTAGRDTAERLARLETALVKRDERLAGKPAQASTAAMEMRAQPEEQAKLDAMLMTLAQTVPAAPGDAMPANPADDAPLTDPGFKDAGPVRAALDAKTLSRRMELEPAPAGVPPRFDPASVERPPRPQSSFADTGKDPFAPPEAQAVVPDPSIEPTISQSSTSTFVAAARRAQRAKQESQASAASSNSLISKALSRVMPARTETDSVAVSPAEVMPVEPQAEVKPAKAPKPTRAERAEKKAAEIGPDGDEPVEAQSFLMRHRRPLLLAATLVAVSMLALNLVMQRMNPDGERPVPSPAPSVTEPEIPEPAPSPSSLLEEAAPAADTAMVQPTPRVIDMVDASTVGSIDRNAATSFSKPVETTPMPTALVARADEPAKVTPADAPMRLAPIETGSIPNVEDTADIPEPFELAPEAVGPIELRQAAADGDARAQFEIGAIYTEGRAVKQDYAAAATWYERSAAQGFVPAQYRLGNLYEAGNGVEKDIEVAKLWYQRGAEAGNRMAMHNLAALYASGQLGEQQFETAAEWFEQAANRGMTDSQFNLGMLYARGLGVEQDLEQSYKWFSLAARNGDADAGKARDDMARSLSADAVKVLNEDIAAWKAEPIDLSANFAPIGTWAPAFDPGETIKTRDVVTKVQDALSRLGYDIGTADGLVGPKTAEAIKAFERSTGMSESGQINPRLLAVLGSQPV
jgi:localization factor PodJL